MSKKVTILGSTGSIGKNTLKVISSLNNSYSVYALAANNNIDKLVSQAKRFLPKKVAIRNKKKYKALKFKLKETNIKVLCGLEGIIEISCAKEVDTVVIATSGSESIYPLIEIIKHNKKIAIANKESIVMAGQIINKLLSKYSSKLIPVDSEHNAVFQCLENNSINDVKKIILTASGGPFFDLKKSKFDKITPKQALNHPRWSMGKKISIDSATLMNKALEIVEACYLFSICWSKIKILIHPESIIHSMVEFKDGNIIAVLGPTDMRLAIHHALTYPKRVKFGIKGLDFSKISNLHLKEPDIRKFPSLRLGFKAAEFKGTLPAVMNASNEIAVYAFLDNKLQFDRIVKVVEYVMNNHKIISNPTLQDIIESDIWARDEAKKIITHKEGL